MKNKLLGLILFTMFGFSTALQGALFSRATVQSFVGQVMAQEDSLTKHDLDHALDFLGELVTREAVVVNHVKKFIIDFLEIYKYVAFYNFLNNWFELSTGSGFQNVLPGARIYLTLLQIARGFYEVSGSLHGINFREKFESFIQSRNMSLESLFSTCEPHADDLPGAFVAERPEQQPENIEPTVEGKRNFNPIYYTLAVIAGCGLTFLVLGLAVDYGIIKQGH